MPGPLLECETDAGMTTWKEWTFDNHDVIASSKWPFHRGTSRTGVICGKDAKQGQRGFYLILTIFSYWDSMLDPLDGVVPVAHATLSPKTTNAFHAARGVVLMSLAVVGI